MSDDTQATEMASELKPQALILYGTQTGTAEELAEQLHETLEGEGLSPRLENMFDISLETAKQYQSILILVSTWGDGDPPDDAEKFHEELKQAPSGSLAGRKFAVFGLGDTGYDAFNQCSKDFDSFFELAGAERLLPRVEADIDFEDDFEIWQEAIKDLLI